MKQESHDFSRAECQKGKIFNISVDHEVILPEVEMDNSILGSNTEAYAICLKKRAKVPFTEDYVEFE